MSCHTGLEDHFRNVDEGTEIQLDIIPHLTSAGRPEEGSVDPIASKRGRIALICRQVGGHGRHHRGSVGGDHGTRRIDLKGAYLRPAGVGLVGLLPADITGISVQIF